ncbi:MAG TPA: hypothetical protein VGI45_29665 [Terracidiphilus sp.]|jgi:hypothetical protein
MIECIFTIDYEVYGDGTGALEELVCGPTERLLEIFDEWDAKFVNFVEVAEFEKIEMAGTDAAIGKVKAQIKTMYHKGYEIALHLHPQWANGKFENGHWHLDSSEYNLCTLPTSRISQIVDGAFGYLRHVLDDSNFSPLSFRAGNWLFQPTASAAKVLGERGVRVDSSVFKGGVQRNHGLDYRAASKNGYLWPFRTDANKVDASGDWIEVPIYTEMVPAWKMATAKRLKFVNGGGVTARPAMHKVNRALDLLRIQYPKKFDFCRMNFEELTSMINRVIREDQATPDVYKPLVAIGHSKDLTDFKTIHDFLAFLHSSQIGIATFQSSWPRLLEASRTVSGSAVDA